ncbi:protein psiD [Drosophila persimilis]|uniref:protein psiD n=1 Tax=Drosophila persimilis TaxID=7234 RepID=UPI000F0743C8|nr:protein psiD [Drosophila persimilis]
MSNRTSSALGCLLGLLLASSSALGLEKCIYCRGINCQRSSYQAEEQCSDRLDACASVFQGDIVQAQGCLEGLEAGWREQCHGPSGGVDCEICVSEKCNTLGSARAGCLQCAESGDEHCVDAPQLLVSQRCPIARTGGSFCFTKLVEERLERGCSLSLSDQLDCLANSNCQLCDPLERPHCNDEIIDFNAAPDPTTESTSTSTSTTSTPTQSTATPSTASPQTTPSTASPQTTPSTASPQPTTASPQPTAPPTTAEPNSALSLHSAASSIPLIIVPLAVFVYTLHK